MTRIAQTLWIGGLCLAAVLAILLAWTASQTPHAAHYLWMQWRPATLDWFVQREIPIAARMPVDQADYWLIEIDRIVGKNPTDAQLAIGAAMIVEEPETDFWQPYSAQFYAPVRDANQPFESACADRDWRLIEQAIALEPGNPQWRRVQALMLIRHGSYWFADSPPLARIDDWRPILAECAQHDPGNALYHYIAAMLYWDQSFENWAISGDRKIIDPKSYDLGMESLEKALTLPLQTGESASGEAKLAFLEQTTLSPSDRWRMLASDRMRHRLRFVFRSLFDRHDLPKYPLLGLVAPPGASLTPAEQQMQLRMNAQTSLENLRRDMQLRAQWEGTSAELDIMLAPTSEVETSIFRMLYMSTSNPNLFTPDEQAELLTLYEAEVRRTAIQRQLQANPLSAAPGYQIPNMYHRLTGDALAMLIPPLLLIALGGFVASRFRPKTPPSVGPIAATLCLILAAAVIFTIFGLGTAHVIDRVILSRTLTALLFVLPMLAIVAAAVQYVRKYGAPLTRVQFLLVLFGGGLALRFIVPATIDFDEWVNWASYWGSPSRHAIFDDWLRRLDGYHHEHEACAQWLSYGGPALTIFLWAILLGIVAWGKTWFQPPRDLPETLGALCQSWLRRGLELALVAAICYLLAARWTLDIAHADEQYRRNAAVQPAAPLQERMETMLGDAMYKRAIEQDMTAKLELLKWRMQMSSPQSP
ncbi:hypothetical protein [Blastopirellula marina]|uniref:Short chain dehydrogenase n=1 Tax=Blastopirellula marina DSM 3645 TaxID=314230 RepID=A3ZZ34_9BACT|nr:hypothetical protein [Blastopirellula marina]EAQ78236.1 short chain dehydrogenase [Blastopirellula marina DSM 3645]